VYADKDVLSRVACPRDLAKLAIFVKIKSKEEGIIEELPRALEEAHDVEPPI